MTSNADLIRRSIFAALVGVAVMSVPTTTTHTVNAAGGGSTACPMTAKCPIDDTVSNYVQSEFSGMIEIGIYEHSLTTGGTHRFRVKCN